MRQILSTCPFDRAVHLLMELLMKANIALAELKRLPCASTSLLLAVSSSFISYNEKKRRMSLTKRIVRKKGRTEGRKEGTI